MANAPAAVYWLGQNGNTYVKGANGVQDYGKLPSGSTIAGATQINDPVASTKGGSTIADSGNGSTDTSSFDQGIDATNAQINDLTPSYNNLLSGANNDYQTTINNLEQGKANADKTYGLNKTADAQDYSGAKNTIRTNTGTTINGIDAVLGSHGGGGQSAGGYAALLAGKAGTGQLTDAGTNFGKNEQGLDTNYNDFLTGYNTNKTNAGLQRDSAVSQATANIDTQKANLLQSLATLVNQRTAASGGKGTAASQPYVDQAKQLLTTASAIGAPKSVAAVTPTTYTPPALTSYTTNPTAAPTTGATGATDTSQPFYASLLNRSKALQTA